MLSSVRSLSHVYLWPYGLQHARLFHCIGDASNHLILCHFFLLLPSVFPSIRVFSSESALHIRWPKYWRSVSASVLPVNFQGKFPLGLTSLITLLSKGLSRSSPTPQFKNINSLVLSFLYGITLTYMMSGKTTTLTRRTFAGKVMFLLLICYLGWSQLLF